MNPFQWKGNEIMEWICAEYDRSERCYEQFPLKNFKHVKNFPQLTREDFTTLAESKAEGDFLYECKEKLMSCFRTKVETFAPRQLENWTPKDIMYWITEEYTRHDMDYEQIPLRKFSNITINRLKHLTLSELIELIGNVKDGQFIYERKSTLFHKHDVITPYPNFLSPSADNLRSSRRPGRPKTNFRSDFTKVKRCGKLWEFLRNLLMDASTCPSLIKWESYEEGTFKFVQSEKVAKLWGDRKNNGNMNYEKFSRAMRYYYRSQVLLPVSGKRLVYKFGPNATGWKNINPIL